MTQRLREEGVFSKTDSLPKTLNTAAAGVKLLALTPAQILAVASLHRHVDIINMTAHPPRQTGQTTTEYFR